MRRILVIVVFGLLAWNAFGQVAPDIAKGTSPEEVIRIYGWPKGKSVAEGRENWLYERFQVTFQQGKVVSVSYISSTTATPFRLSTPPRTKALEPATPKPSPSQTIVPSPQVRSSNAPTSKPTRTAPPSDFLVTPATKSNRATTPSVPGGITIWVVRGVTAAGILTGLVVLAINRRGSAKQFSDALFEKSSEPSPKRKSWEEEIAKRLREVDGSKSRPSVEPLRESSIPADTSRAAGRHQPDPPLLETDLTLALLRKLEWKRFEQIVALYYNATGVAAKCTCVGPDGGVDVKLYRKGDERPYCYIQCKAWGSEKIKLTTMREFLGVMAADKINQGIFVTTSDFYLEARTFAVANGIEAMTAEDFIRLFQRLPVESRIRILAEVTAGDYTTPSCPSCDVKLVFRNTSEDKNPFWGCRNYPRCRTKIYPRSNAARN